MKLNQMHQAGSALFALAASSLIAGCAVLPESKTLEPLDKSRVIPPDRITMVEPDRFCVSFEPGFLQCKMAQADVWLIEDILARLPGLRSYHILSIARLRKRPLEIRVELPKTSIILVKKSRSSWDIKYLIDHSNDGPAT